MPLKLITSLSCALSVCVIGTTAFSVNNLERANFKIFELKHPACESQSLIDTAKEGFTTIRNDLPGRSEYNELVKTFHRQKWEKLDEDIEFFQNTFETSPLREAVAFLKVESLFDRIDSLDSEIIKEAEKHLRETVLLYPRSQLIPVIEATMGAFWLRNGLYSKSLGTFIKAKQDYPFHSLNCLFQFGISENNFLLHEFEVAKKGFSSLLQKCSNPRFKTGARLRLAEMQMDKNPKESSLLIASIYQEESNIVARFYQEALYNIGENKYQAKQFTSARFFFNEYLKHKKREPSCAVYAHRRIADISAKLKSPQSDLFSLYLETHDQFPKTDMGRFSYVQALLLDYPQKSPGEKIRRTQVVDEELPLIGDPRLRYLGSLNKALALLESGKTGAIGYLVRIGKDHPEDLKDPEIAEFISLNIVKTLKKEALAHLVMDRKKESLKNEDLFQEIEDAYSIWIKGTKIEKETKQFYTDLITKRFKELLEKENFFIAFGLLERWNKSDLWEVNDPDNRTKIAIGTELGHLFLQTDKDKLNAISKAVVKDAELLTRFLGSDFNPLILTAMANLGNSIAVAGELSKTKSNREIASINPMLSSEVQSFLSYKRAEAQFLTKNFEDTNETLKKVTDKKYKDQAVVLKIKSLNELKKYSDAFKLGSSQISKMNQESKVRVLASLIPTVNGSKIWSKADFLLSEAKKQKVSGLELAPFLFLAGKASSEQKVCKKSIKYISEALTLDPKSPQRNEAQFRLGKCYQKEKKQHLAKQQWKEVIDSKDSFWAPMAKSEINLMEEP
ncbi:MAG: hypothetical protein EXR74_05820 [Bdellovibrionales bacterium]|nr:hypothetical protein [Bdellovibrionales bacterium]